MQDAERERSRRIQIFFSSSHFFFSFHILFYFVNRFACVLFKLVGQKGDGKNVITLCLYLPSEYEYEYIYIRRRRDGMVGGGGNGGKEEI